MNNQATTPVFFVLSQRLDLIVCPYCDTQLSVKAKKDLCARSLTSQIRETAGQHVQTNHPEQLHTTTLFAIA